MRHIIILFMALLPWLGNAQTVVNPDYEYRVSSIFSIRSIERTADCTRLNLRATFRPNWWFSFDKNDKIYNADNLLQSFLPTAIEGLEFGEHRFMGQEGVHDFTVIYPPLPADIKRINLYSDNQLLYKGVSLTETRRDPFAGQREAWMDAHPESPMKEMVRMGKPLTDKDFYNIGTATIRGQIGHYDSRLEMSCMITSNDPVFWSYINTVTIAPDGTFTVTFPISGPTTADVAFRHRNLSYSYSNPLYIEPGQTIDMFVDWEDDILAYDRGRGLLPYPPMVLRGPLAEVNRQIREAPLVPSQWQPRTDRDLKGNLESLQRHQNADMPALRHYLKRSDLLPKAKQYLENNARLIYAGWRMHIPEYLISRQFDDGTGRATIDAEYVRNYCAQMDSSFYFDILREIDLNDITQFATFGGQYFLNDFSSLYTTAFSMAPLNEQLSLSEGQEAMRRSRAAALGYKSLPIAEQLHYLSGRGRLWCKLHDVLNGRIDADDLLEFELRDDYLASSSYERNITHPKLKAMNKRLTKECLDMKAKIMANPSERVQWLEEHLVVTQDNLDKPYDAATFFTTDSVTIRGKIGRYDKQKPLVVYAMLPPHDSFSITDEIAVADDGTFTIRAELTHPGVVEVNICHAHNYNYTPSASYIMELYLEPGHTVETYLDCKYIPLGYVVANAPAQRAHIVRGDLAAMSQTVLNRMRFDRNYGTPENPRAVLDEMHNIRLEDYQTAIDDCCNREVFEKAKQFVASDFKANLIVQLQDILLRCIGGDGIWQTSQVVNETLQQMTLDDFSFLREILKDDLAIIATPAGQKLMLDIACGGDHYLSVVLDALLAGKKQVTREEIFGYSDIDAKLQRRLEFYGGDTLPIFEQAAFVTYIRQRIKQLEYKQETVSSQWLDTMRAAGDMYITHPELRNLLP